MIARELRILKNVVEVRCDLAIVAISRKIVIKLSSKESDSLWVADVRRNAVGPVLAAGSMSDEGYLVGEILLHDVCCSAETMCLTLLRRRPV